MDHFDDVTIFKWIAGVVTLLLGGLGIRGVHSRQGAQAARNSADTARAEAEESYFNTALSEKTIEIEHWRHTSERAWEAAELARKEMADMQRQLDKVKSEARHAEANMKLRVRLFMAQHPSIDTSWLIDSKPAPLESNLFDTDYGKPK